MDVKMFGLVNIGWGKIEEKKSHIYQMCTGEMWLCLRRKR